MSSNLTINAILTELEKEQVSIFDQWVKAGYDEIHGIISAILRERPPQKLASESSRGKTRLLQERKTITHLSDREIREIVNRETGRTPAGTSHDQLKASFERSFLAQGKPPDEAARMADIAATGKRGRSSI